MSGLFNAADLEVINSTRFSTNDDLEAAHYSQRTTPSCTLAKPSVSISPARLIWTTLNISRSRSALIPPCALKTIGTTPTELSLRFPSSNDSSAMSSVSATMSLLRLFASSQLNFVVTLFKPRFRQLALRVALPILGPLLLPRLTRTCFVGLLLWHQDQQLRKC